MKLQTHEPIEGNRFFEGRLESFADGRLTLELSPPRKKKQPRRGGDGEEACRVEIELANVEKANLVPEF